MATRFLGEGNIGIEPDIKTIASNGNNEPAVVMRISVHFDNTVKVGEQYEDRGGFWAQVEFWPKTLDEANRLKAIFQVGMRIKVDGNLVQEKWQDKSTGEERSQMKVRTSQTGISICLQRLELTELVAKKPPTEKSDNTSQEQPTNETNETEFDFDDDIPM